MRHTVHATHVIDCETENEHASGTGKLSFQNEVMLQLPIDCSLKIKKLLHSKASAAMAHSPATPGASGVKLPKLEVLTFDGNMVNWRSFWEQFTVSVHSNSTITDAEKLVTCSSP